MKLFVARLNFKTTESGLKAAFEKIGVVTSAKIVKDRDTGRSKGYGFVEMDDADGQNAINALDGTQLDGREIVVKEAEEKASSHNRR